MRPSSRRILALVVGLAVVAYALTLTDNAAPPRPDATASLTGLAPWTGPAPSSLAARLGDGTAYQPRVFATATDSVGVALTVDGSAWRVLSRMAGRLIELRRVPVVDAPQFNGFAIDHNTVAWAETLVGGAANPQTTIWQADWRTGTAARVTSNTGNAAFSGDPHDLVVSDGRVSWAAEVPPADTEIRSVALSGGQVDVMRLHGLFKLTTSPWAVTPGAGGGVPIQLVNLRTDQRSSVPTGAAEIGTCGPVWCRMVVVANTALVRLDLQRPDGTQRHRVAGAEATPAIDEVALLDRFVPLKVDERDDRGPGLALYDIRTDQTALVATGVDHVQGAGAFVWWTTGEDPNLTWHALDLRGVP
jgi:hypothetical protein